MRIKVVSVPLVGQPWLDVLDYHVRPALESVGDKIDRWAQEDGSLLSPEMTAERAAIVKQALGDVPAARVTIVD
ncbi:MAG: hypothetical protein U0166_12505 [Acidobacteriota bacterium]